MAKLYKGIHGTCRTWGQMIQASGFTPSRGRGGEGCYFWHYYNHDDYAKFLAFRWWQDQSNKGKYNRESGVKDKGCALVKCSFQLDEAEVLDLTNGSLKEQIRNLLKDAFTKIDREETSNKPSFDEITGGVIELFIKKLEEKQDFPIKIIISDLALPKGAGRRIGKFFGASAEAIIVRDISCIQLDFIEKIDKYEYV